MTQAKLRMFEKITSNTFSSNQVKSELLEMLKDETATLGKVKYQPNLNTDITITLQKENDESYMIHAEVLPNPKNGQYKTAFIFDDEYYVLYQPNERFQFNMITSMYYVLSTTTPLEKILSYILPKEDLGLVVKLPSIVEDLVKRYTQHLEENNENPLNKFYYNYINIDNKEILPSFNRISKMLEREIDLVSKANKQGIQSLTLEEFSELKDIQVLDYKKYDHIYGLVKRIFSDLSNAIKLQTKEAYITQYLTENVRNFDNFFKIDTILLNLSYNSGICENLDYTNDTIEDLVSLLNSIKRILKKINMKKFNYTNYFESSFGIFEQIDYVPSRKPDYISYQKDFITYNNWVFKYGNFKKMSYEEWKETIIEGQDKISSIYWWDNVELIRLSKHWGECRDCFWSIKDTPQAMKYNSEPYIARILFSDLEGISTYNLEDISEGTYTAICFRNIQKCVINEDSVKNNTPLKYHPNHKSNTVRIVNTKQEYCSIEHEMYHFNNEMKNLLYGN